MDQNRYFGIEIECISRVAGHQLSTKINQAFRDNNIEHDCSTDSYGHSRGNNRTHWGIKPDSSINSTARFRHACEIVSPKLQGDEGLKALKVVCDAIDGSVNVNRSCGLHVHHDIRNSEDVRHLVNAWIDNEKYFMQVTPRSRRDNRYCKTWNSIHYGRSPQKLSVTETGRVNKTQIDNKIRNWWHNSVGTRYTTLNMEGYLYRGAVEIRLHSATYEYTKMANWIIATQEFVNKALMQEMPASDSFDDFCDKLISSNSTSARVENVRRAANVSSEYHIHPDAKKQRLPRETSKLGVIARMVLAGGHTKQEIADKLREQFGAETAADSTSYEFRVTAKIADMASLKYGFGWNVITRRGRYYVVPLRDDLVAEDTVIVEAVETAPANVDQLTINAISWMRTRQAHFGHLNN
ncbi:MAG: hypothetical protein DRJ03_01180 [Chloroflexi bacterium]|nr:MAG: hypothetical protein DRJ03_01180 [Chloroflexota bacterium]